MNTVQQIESAIATLSPQQLEELYAWLDENYTQFPDARMQADLAAGRLDHAIFQALEDEEAGRTKLLSCLPSI